MARGTAQLGCRRRLVNARCASKRHKAMSTSALCLDSDSCRVSAQSLSRYSLGTKGGNAAELQAMPSSVVGMCSLTGRAKSKRISTYRR